MLIFPRKPLLNPCLCASLPVTAMDFFSSLFPYIYCNISGQYFFQFLYVVASTFFPQQPGEADSPLLTPELTWNVSGRSNEPVPGQNNADNGEVR